MSAQELTKTILLVDDDQTFRTTLRDALVKNGWAVTEATDGAQALELITDSPQNFVIVLSDINMPKVTGLDLLQASKKLSKGLPFILFTGVTEFIETKIAYDLGADDFLPKPFKMSDLLPLIESHTAQNLQNDSQAHGSGEYCRVSIEEFVVGSKIDADIYIKISDSKYIKVARSKTYLPLERIEAYKAKGLRFLYITKSDFCKYVGLNLTIATAAVKSDKFNVEQKKRLLKHTAEIMVQDIFVNGCDKDKFDLMSGTLETSVAVMSDQPDLAKMLEMLRTHADGLYAHSLGVALYGGMIAQNIGWKSTGTLFKVSMGGLLHDIGKKELPKELLEKQRSDLTVDEVKIIESHSARGKEILMTQSYIPSDVILIAAQHHERFSGRGYPSNMKRADIHPLARLIAVADAFCSKTIKKAPRDGIVDAHSAIKEILSFEKAEFDPVFLWALLDLFKYPQPDDFKRFEKRNNRNVA